MRKVIITGGIGSGKSYIANLFHTLYQVPVFNTDLAAKEIMQNNPQLIQSILGEEAIVEGQLNKAFIGDKIFQDPTLRQTLDKALHPKLSVAFDKFRQYHTEPYCLYECATLPPDRFPYLIGVIADLEIRIQRIQKRSGWSLERIQQVMQIQMSQPELISRCHYVIVNNGKLDLKVIGEIHDRIS